MSFIRKNIYFIPVLIVQAIIISINIAAIITIKSNRFDAVVINLSGRQRMLSQRIAAKSLLLHCRKDATEISEHEYDELKNLLKTFQDIHDGLVNGNETYNLPKLNNDKIEGLFKEIHPSFSALCNAAKKIASKTSESDIKILNTLLKGQEKYLAFQDEITSEFESVANARLNKSIRVLWILSVFVILLIIFELLFVFRPIRDKLGITEKNLDTVYQRYNHLYNKTPAMMHSIDNQGKIVTVSDYWLEKMGYNAEEVIGHASSEFLTEESKKYAEEIILPEYFKKGYCKDVPYQFVKKNGEIIDALLSATSEKDNNGNIVRSLAVIADVTGLKQTKTKLREKNNFINRILETSDQLFYVIRINEKEKYNNKVEYISPQSNAIYGVSSEEFFKDPDIWFNSIHPEDVASVIETTQKVCKDLVPLTRIYRAKNQQTKEYVWLEDFVYPVKENGYILLHGSARDISEKVQSKNELENAYKELQLVDNVNLASIENRPLQDLIDQTMNAFSEFARLKGGRFYLYEEENGSLLLKKENLKNNVINKIEEKIGVNIKTIVPLIKEGNAFYRAIKTQTMIVAKTPKEITTIIEEHTEIPLLKKFASWSRSLIGIKTFIVIPLVSEQKIFGIITQYSDEVLTDEIIKKIQRFTNSITAAFAKTLAEQETQEQKHFMENILNNLPADIVVFDNHHNYQFINQTAIADTATRSWLLGKNDFDYFKHKNKSLDEAQKRRNHFNKAKETQADVTWTDSYGKEGNKTYMLRKLHPVVENNSVKYVLGYGIDITERVQAEKVMEQFTHQLEEKVKERTDELTQIQADLQEALVKEKEAGELKSRFVSTASHQFRTPMAIIQSNSELLGMIAEKSDSSIQNMLNRSTARIKKEIKRMTDLMDEVLILGKISSGNMTISKKESDVKALCLDLIEQYNGIQKDGRKVEFNITGTPKAIIIDEKLMTHAISNLLSNAFKYSSKQNPVLNVKYEPRFIKIEIIDKGIGISQKELKNLFQPFYRAENAKDFEGTGLGLAIVKEYVELCEGQIQVDSELNKGTTFTITLNC